MRVNACDGCGKIAKAHGYGANFYRFKNMRLGKAKSKFFHICEHCLSRISVVLKTLKKELNKKPRPPYGYGKGDYTPKRDHQTEMEEA